MIEPKLYVNRSLTELVIFNDNRKSKMPSTAGQNRTLWGGNWKKNHSYLKPLKDQIVNWLECLLGCSLPSDSSFLSNGIPSTTGQIFSIGPSGKQIFVSQKLDNWLNPNCTWLFIESSQLWENILISFSSEAPNIQTANLTGMLLG